MSPIETEVQSNSGKLLVGELEFTVNRSTPVIRNASDSESQPLTTEDIRQRYPMLRNTDEFLLAQSGAGFDPYIVIPHLYLVKGNQIKIFKRGLIQQDFIEALSQFRQQMKESQGRVHPVVLIKNSPLSGYPHLLRAYGFNVETLQPSH